MIATNNISISKKGVPYAKLLPSLEEKLGKIPFNGKDTFMNVYVETEDKSQKYARLTVLLNEVIKNIVKNYFQDHRIRNVYQLDSQFESILKLAEPIPYRVGMYRPDFIFDKNGNEKICEIGCRYPINGWMLSHYTQLVFEELIGYAHPDKDSFISVITEDLSIDDVLFCLHKNEKGTEVFLFFNELKKNRFTVADASPDQLELKNGQLFLGDKPAKQFILEMDREELKDIHPEILKTIIEKGKCLNDVRTLILVHDKRILSVLYDAQIMKDYISEEDYTFLQEFLIPSYALHSEIKRTEVLSSTSNWVLKKNSGGRGIDMYIKNECTPKLWKTILKNEWQEYMVQEFVPQDTFELMRDDTIQNIHLVGMLLCYNANSFGLGVFRGAKKTIINVNNGGYILASIVKD